MLTFIIIVLVLSFLFRRGGLARGLFGGGLFGCYRRRPPFHYGPMGGHGFGCGPGSFGPMGRGMGGHGFGPGMGGGPGGRGGRF